MQPSVEKLILEFKGFKEDVATLAARTENSDLFQALRRVDGYLQTWARGEQSPGFREKILAEYAALEGAYEEALYKPGAFVEEAGMETPCTDGSGTFD